jgi:phosphopantothenoylcysteine decarboxylase/phosphopantothenate--cysteine ligase
MLQGRKVLLVIGGGIAAYKCLELIRRLRDRGASVVPVMTGAASEFVTPLSVSALAGHKVYRDLFDLTDEAEMGHIQLSRAADLVVVAPATADMMAKMAQGLAGERPDVGTCRDAAQSGKPEERRHSGRRTGRGRHGLR